MAQGTVLDWIKRPDSAGSEPASGGGTVLDWIKRGKASPVQPPDTSGFDIKPPEQPDAKQRPIFFRGPQVAQEEVEPSALDKIKAGALFGADAAAKGFADIGEEAARLVERGRQNIFKKVKETPEEKAENEARLAHPPSPFGVVEKMRRIADARFKEGVIPQGTEGGFLQAGSEAVGGMLPGVAAAVAAPEVALPAMVGMGGLQSAGGGFNRVLQETGDIGKAGVAEAGEGAVGAAGSLATLGALKGFPALQKLSQPTRALMGTFFAATENGIGGGAQAAINGIIEDRLTGDERDQWARAKQRFLEAAGPSAFGGAVAHGVGGLAGMHGRPAVEGEPTPATDFERANTIRPETPPSPAQESTGTGGTGKVPTSPGESLPQVPEAGKPGETTGPTEINLGDRRAVERGGEERRQDVEKRKQVADMTAEERAHALLTNDLTGLPNRRAFNEARDRGDFEGKTYAAYDGNSFGFMNTKFGHEGGDKIIQAMGKAAEGEPGVYHLSGDEFVAMGDTPEDAKAKIARIKQKAREQVYSQELEGEPGKVGTVHGLEIAAGYGRSYKEADTASERTKRLQGILGLRAEKGKQPHNFKITEKAAEAPTEQPAPAESGATEETSAVPTSRAEATRSESAPVGLGTPEESAARTAPLQERTQGESPAGRSGTPEGGERIGRHLAATIEEGRAAAKLGLPASANPYRKFIREQGAKNIEADARTYELAADWDSGHATGGEQITRQREPASPGLPLFKKPPESKQAGAVDLFGGKKEPEPAAGEEGRFDVPDVTKRDKLYSAVVNDFQRIVNLEKAAPNKPEGMSLEHALSAFPGKRFGESEKLQKLAVDPLKSHLQEQGIPPIKSTALKPSASDYLYAVHAQDMASKGGVETGMSAKDAQAILSKAGPEYAKVREWNRALNVKRLDVLEKSGLISSEQRAAWEEKYGPDYVPLRTAKDPFEVLFGGKGLQVSGKESKAREGRSSKADSPLAFAVETMQTALDRAESNKIGRKLASLVEKNPEPSLWRIETDANKIKDGEERLAYKENGEQRYIVTKDKGLADAFKRITKPDPGVLKLVDVPLKFLHNVIVRYNPLFSLRNVQRDVGEATIKHAIRGDLGAALSQLKGEGPAIKGALQAIRKEGSGGKWGDLYRDARENGALIGWREQFSYEDRVKDFEKAFTKTGKVKAFLGLIDDLNRSAELGTRLSAYDAFLKGGMSKAEAAMETRRITADFARRGSLAPIYRRIYLFSGANVQGLGEFARSIKNNPGKASVVIGSLIGAGLVNQRLSKAYGDEHELDKLSEYDKIRHFGVMVGKRKYGFTAPYVFSIFPYIGWKIGELMDGDTSKADALSNVAQQAIGVASPLPQGANLIQSLTPTLARPAMELAQNQKFSGAPIYPEQDQFSKVPKPASKLFFRNVSPASKAITDKLHEATGGTEVKPGAVEISPEVIDHIAAAMTGGVGTFASGTWDVVRKMLTGQTDQIRATDIPGARAFIAEPSRGAEGQLFKKNVGEVEMSKAQKKAREEPDKPEALRLHGSASDAEKKIRALYKKMDLEGLSEQDRNEIQERIDEIRERFNRRAKPVLRGQ